MPRIFLPYCTNDMIDLDAGIIVPLRQAFA